ncbi:hypothetical protein Pcinc_018129 [Petrolisthes cinctipes]|uniref:DUF4097 domain-containing protein n=1 Tax=Petrolisthes cinctipes TaxID=88211 RepID=A0AAE1KJM7_PETCI|nr:hypothetical protein Pcinc_018129 [Petrolisthes cinctipes]
MVVEESYVKVKSKAISVNPGFGALHTAGTINFFIKPTSPQEYPDADQAFVNVYGLPSTRPTCEDINIELTGELQDTLTISATPTSSQMYCEVLVPIKYDLDVSLLGKACVQISGMEADDVKISTEEGEIRTKGLKSHNIHITTKEGNITSEGSLQGNIFIRAKKTHLTAKRLQGLVIDVEAEELTTAVESSYMNQGQITAQCGDVKISNLHGCTDLMVKEGQIVIRGLHGQISAFMKTGKIDAQVTDVTGHSTLHVNKGELTLSIIDTPRHGLEVCAPSLEVSEEVLALGSTSNTSDSTSSSTASSPTATPVFSLTQNNSPDINILRASVTEGVAEVKSQSWFSTLGIKMERDD